MIKEQRAAIAAIVIAISKKNIIQSVYSYEQGKHVTLSGKADTKTINLYDYDRGCHVSGNASQNYNYSLYDYGVSAHISLVIKGTKFDGYDYKSSKHFSGTVNGSSVSIYDYETGAYYQFA